MGTKEYSRYRGPFFAWVQGYNEKLDPAHMDLVWIGCNKESANRLSVDRRTFKAQLIVCSHFEACRLVWAACERISEGSDALDLMKRTTIIYGEIMKELEASGELFVTRKGKVS